MSGPRALISSVLPAFRAAFAAFVEEARSWPGRASMCWLLFGAPLLVFALLWIVFGTGSLRELPVAICDQDRSTLSRGLSRWVDACPSMRVAHVVDNPDDGERLLRQGKIYAFLLIPDGFGRDVLRKRPVHFMAWLEGQHIATAGILSRDISDIGMSFWRAQDGEMRRKSGTPAETTLLQTSTITLDLRPVGNPSTNYRVFLLPGLLPALIQLLASLASACSLHRLSSADARRTGSATSRAGRIPRILGAQLALTLWFTLLGCGLSGLLFLHGDLLLKGSFASLIPAWALLAACAAALGHMLSSAGESFLQGLSLISVWSSPAFAFGGLSFPLAAMPLLGRMWAITLPVTHFIHYQVHAAQLGAPLSSQAAPLVSLAALALIYTGAGLFLGARKEPESPVPDTPPYDGTGAPRGIAGAFAEAGRELVRNHAALTILAGGVLLYSLLYPMPYHNQVPQKLPVLAADLDHSNLSRQFLRMIDATEGARVAGIVDSAPLALERLKRGEAQAVLVIPSDFSRNLLRGGRSVLPLYSDAGYLLPYRMAFRGIRLAAENLGAGVRVERFRGAGMPEKPALALQTRGQATVRTLYNPSGNYFLNTVPAVFVLILQQTLIIGSAMLAGRAWNEKKLFMERRAATSPAGRILLLCCLYAVHAFYYFWLLPLLYDVPRPENFGLLLLFLLPFFWAAASMGSMFARLIRRPETVLVALLPCSLPMLFLSGCIWPPESMPEIARLLAQLLPSTPGINGYLRIMGRNAGWADILPLWLQLWGLAGIYYALALFAARRPDTPGV